MAEVRIVVRETAGELDPYSPFGADVLFEPDAPANCGSPIDDRAGKIPGADVSEDRPF